MAFLTMTDEEGLPLVPAPHHWLWLHLLCEERIHKLLIIAPPESAKTTWLLAYLATSIGFSPEWPRILAAASGPVAEQRSVALRTLIESTEYLEIFPNVKPAAGMAWEKKNWSVAPSGRPRPGRIHPTVAAYGTGGSITGSRAREAIGDDILDFDNTRTAYQRDLVSEWLHNSFFSRLISRRGRVIVIGTSWHHDDAYSRLRQGGGWVVCHTPLLHEGPTVRATITYPPHHLGAFLGVPVANP